MKIVVGFGLASLWCASLSLFAASGLQWKEQKKYMPRLAAAERAGGAWERYVALNHGWSPGAWCVGWPGLSALHARWAGEAESALLDALEGGDARAVSYLYSPEARWWCLDGLRAQYPEHGGR